MLANFEQYAAEVERGLKEDRGAQDWPDPVPFEEVQTSDFPTDALPGPLASFVHCLAENTQTPEEMAGLLSLGVLSTAFQSRYTVQVTRDWREPLCLFCVAVAPPGERKSAVIGALAEPVYEWEAQQQEIDGPEIHRNRMEREILEGEAQAAKTAAIKGKGDRQRALDLAAELASFPVLYEKRLLADDATPEKLADMLDQQGGSLTVCSAEGGVFDALRGRYDRAGGLDVYLKAHAGDPLFVDRIGRASNRIVDPRLTLILTVQPEVLTGLMSNGTFRGRGLCGRFLYAMCRSKVGHRDIQPPEIPGSIRQGYREFVRDCLCLNPKSKGMIALSEEASQRRVAFQEKVERKLGDQWEHMRDWGGKLTGAVLRIAALLHCSSVAGDPTQPPISGETMEAAVRIGDFLASHAEVAYQAMGADGELADAAYLVKRLTGLESVSRSELTRLCRGRFAKAEEMDPALLILEERGYVRTVEAPVGYNNRRQIIYEINPALWRN